MKAESIKANLFDVTYDAIVAPCFEEDDPSKGQIGLLDKKCEGLVKEVIGAGDFTGKPNEVSVLYTGRYMPTKRVLLLGLGKKNDFSLEKLRCAYAYAARKIRNLQQKTIVTAVNMLPSSFPVEATIEAVIEGIYLGLYQFTPFRTLDRDDMKNIESVTVLCDDAKTLKSAKSAIQTAEIIAKAVYFVRDIVSTPGNEMTPTDLANEARDIASRKAISVKILDAAPMKELGMNALLGVARGSDEPPKFIILEYRGGSKNQQPAVIVGKGITFDSGGISLKPSERMEEMKSDMAGAGAALGVIMAAADLKLPFNITALVPATENLPGGKALKPGDILKSLSGKTVEIVNTDAEGRLILADALAYAVTLKPSIIVDLATLTGACIVALGRDVIGMLGTNEALKKSIIDSSRATGEKVWELPLWQEYHEAIKSEIADFKNAGSREAGTITAAAFLSKFVENYPWVHLDIAGPAWLEKEKGYVLKGASGVGVRLLVEFFRHHYVPGKFLHLQ